jgi:hypothetical protein
MHKAKLFIKLSFLILQGLLILPADAQQIQGLEISNNGGLYRASYNPAVLGGTRYKFQINLLTMGGSINNRYFRFAGKNSFLTPILASGSEHEIYGRSRTMGTLIENDPIYLTSDIRWPSVLFSAGERHGFAIQFRTRGFIQGNNIPAPIRQLYAKRMDTDLEVPSTGTWGAFNLMQQSFSEIALSYGISLIKSDFQHLRIGATAKRVTGARLSYINGNIESFTINTPADPTLSKELVLENTEFESGYSSPLKKTGIWPVFNGNNFGNGWAYDLGVSYEIGSVWTRNKEEYNDSPDYLLRISASVTDVGKINYNHTNNYSETGNATSVSLRQMQLETIADQGPKGFMQVFNGVANEESIAFNPSLPAALHLDADVQLARSFYINVSKTKRMNSETEDFRNIYQPEYIMVTPRFEDDDFDLAFPVTFIKGNSKPNIGFTAHFGPLFVGFSNITGILGSSKRSAMGFVGLSVFKFKK